MFRITVLRIMLFMLSQKEKTHTEMFMLFMFYCFRKQTHTMHDQKRSEHSPHSSVAMSPNYTATLIIQQ